MAGKFITFEGGEGAGKSTQIRLLGERLTAAGHAVVATREPGGTPTAEEIRRVLLSGIAEQLGPDGEAVLFAAARADHVERVIRPALRAGKWVLSDRFSDSTRVYQGVGGGVDSGVLDALDRVAVGRTQPDLTIVLDVPSDVGLARAAQRTAASGEPADRFERDDLALHEARREAFLAIARAEPERCLVVDATQGEQTTANVVWQAVAARLIDRAA
ncbi:MAG TPA: dTMP kinase [Bauldia sp.]